MAVNLQGLESILDTTKKALGIQPESTEFDPDILMQINAAIMILRQIGVGPKEGFTVTGSEETYEDWLGDAPNNISLAKQNLFARVRLGFDPPQSSYVCDCLKEMIRETECRLSYQVDDRDTFE